ncbi:MAG: hypothetical protein JWO46_580 [Nocardioidaceae bacterium]|nr:hypothetical protein [Nocardioidaceae bacterium]
MGAVNTRVHTSARAVSAVVAVLALAGCADGGPTRPVAAPTAGPVVGSTRPQAAAACAIAGFRPTTVVTVTSEDPRVLYLHTIAVGPGTTGHGSADATLSAYPPLDPGVRFDDPQNAILDPATRDAILDQVPGSTLLDAVRGLSWKVANPGADTRRYLVYAGATVRRGSWEVRRCGGSVNDGRTVASYRGTFTKIGRIGSGVVRCLGRPDRPVPGAAPLGGQNLLRGAATRAACRPTPDSYRQFHDPTA